MIFATTFEDSVNFHWRWISWSPLGAWICLRIASEEKIPSSPVQGPKLFSFNESRKYSRMRWGLHRKIVAAFKSPGYVLPLEDSYCPTNCSKFRFAPTSQSRLKIVSIAQASAPSSMFFSLNLVKTLDTSHTKASNHPYHHYQQTLQEHSFDPWESCLKLQRTC